MAFFMVFLLFGDRDGFIIAHFWGIVNGVLQEMKSLLSALRRHARGDVHCGGYEKTKNTILVGWCFVCDMWPI